MVPKGYTPLNDFVSQSGPICYGILKPGTHIENGVPVIKVKNIMGGEIHTQNLLKTSNEIHQQYKRAELKSGDVLLTIRGSTGRVAIVPEELCGANITQDTARIRVSTEDCPLYILYALQSPQTQTQKQIALNTIGQAVKGINIAEVKKLEILHPSPSEQRKIAQILSSWDKAISTTESLIANSQQQKKSLMQQLLTGKKRFSEFNNGSGFKKTKYGLIPNDWKNVDISDIASQYSNKNTEDKSYPVLSCSKHLGFIDSLKYFNKKIYSDDLTDYKTIPHGYFGFPSNHIEEGSIDCQNLYKIGLVSPIYTIFKPNNLLVDNKFLISILKTDHYRQIFSASTNASVDRRGSLKWKEFSLIKIALPSLHEQQKIASVLTATDKETEILQQKLTHLIQEKKALMQQLLTGKRRVMI